MNEKSDLELLQEFVQDQAEAPFEQIVRRYLDLVHSAALRLVVDPHLAEDVSQNVFSALARQSKEVMAKVAVGASLSGWLHTTTRNLAVKSVRTEVRRRAREQEAGTMALSSLEELHETWDQIAPHLDHALGDLSEHDRDALLLRFFERKTSREIAVRFGVSEGAAQKRISRALDKLRDRFLARGIALPSAASATLLPALLGTHAVQAAPLALTASVAKAALGLSAAAAPLATTAGSIHFLPFLVMTKTQASVLAAVVLACAVPVCLQQVSLRELQAVPTRDPAPLLLTPSPQDRQPVVNRESEASELARLRREAEQLRAALAARRRQNTNQAQPDLARGPVLLALGKPAVISDLTFAGNESPEAALQSLLAFRRDGNVEGATRLMLLSPERAALWNQLLASPEQREKLVREMIEGTAGVVIASSVRVDEDGAASAAVESKRFPEPSDRPPTVEIIDKATFDERRIQFSIRIVHGSQTNTEHLVFGMTQTGWKGID